jgi:small subunit ribosomal protein S8
MMTDPIADLLTRIRNAQAAELPSTSVRFSKVKENIAHILKSEGFITDVKVSGEGIEKHIELGIRYDPEGRPMILGLERVSRPGRRVYVGADDIPKVLGGLGVAIVSTSQGVMTGNQARRRHVGGEVLCRVW